MGVIVVDIMKLARSEWKILELKGEGGFGHVYLAEDGSGNQRALKFVPKAPGADRELLMAELNDARNVVPVIMTDESEDAWVLVMPVAECSLQDRLDDGPPMSTDEAILALRDVCDALSDIVGKVVHRDLKPANVLLLDGHWCISDFGIARYAEATTATDTRKPFMTWAYTAPERWRYETATEASDIYSFGVMAYQLLSG